MKAVKLNKEQREQLLEMCVKLFPEYKSIYFGNGWMNSFVCFDNLPLDSRDVHWFELCMLELSLRLYVRIREDETYLSIELDPDFQDGTEILQLFIWKHQHPVDHLYKEFKKLT